MFIYLLYNAIKCQTIEMATLFVLRDVRHKSHCIHMYNIRELPCKFRDEP